MNVVLPIPDDLVEQLGPADDLARRALEALAIAEYRAHRLTELQLRRMLGFASQDELDGFLKDRCAVRDPETVVVKSAREVLQGATKNERKAADELVARFEAFAAQHSLGGLSVKELIEKGRR